MSVSYVMVAIAIAANLIAVYFMKLCAGMTLPWPTLGMILANMLTLWFLGRAMVAGAPVSAAVTALTVGVMIGSFLIEFSFGARISVFPGIGGVFPTARVCFCNLV